MAKTITILKHRMKGNDCVEICLAQQDPSAILGRNGKFSWSPWHSERPHTFFWLGFLCHYRANCKKRSNDFCGISNSKQ